MAAMIAVYFLYGLQPFLFAYDHWIGLCTSSLLMSLFQVRRAFFQHYVHDLSDGTSDPLNILFIGDLLLCYVLRSGHHAGHWR